MNWYKISQIILESAILNIIFEDPMIVEKMRERGILSYDWISKQWGIWNNQQNQLNQNTVQPQTPLEIQPTPPEEQDQKKDQKKEEFANNLNNLNRLWSSTFNNNFIGKLS